jgi:hypothetical protein
VGAVERIAALIPAHLEGSCFLPPLHLEPERLPSGTLFISSALLSTYFPVRAYGAF